MTTSHENNIRDEICPYCNQSFESYYHREICKGKTMTKYPINDLAPYRNFRNVIHTCLSCEHCECLFNGKLNCVKTINQPKPNTICDEYVELKQRGNIND